MTPLPLPRDEDGFIVASAKFGETWIVRVEYNTDFDGRQIDPAKEEYPCTFHGTFESEDEAVEWMDAFCPDDTDIHEATAMVMNRVRPEEGTENG